VVGERQRPLFAGGTRTSHRTYKIDGTISIAGNKCELPAVRKRAGKLDGKTSGTFARSVWVFAVDNKKEGDYRQCGEGLWVVLSL